jgi:hypothetical protein
MDEKVFRFVAHTGFTHFEKGILWHERMYVFPPFFSASLSFPLKRALPFFLEQRQASGNGSLQRVRMNASFDCLYAQCSPVKEIGGESCG